MHTHPKRTRRRLMELTKTDYGKVIKYLSDSAKMYRLSERARHQDRARQINNLIWKLKKKNKT